MNETIPEQSNTLAESRPGPSRFGLLSLASVAMILGLVFLCIAASFISDSFLEYLISDPYLYAGCFCFTSVAGILFGVAGLFEPNKRKASAVAGLILSIVLPIVIITLGCLLFVAAVVYGLSTPG